MLRLGAPGWHCGGSVSIWQDGTGWCHGTGRTSHEPSGALDKYFVCLCYVCSKYWTPQKCHADLSVCVSVSTLQEWMSLLLDNNAPPPTCTLKRRQVVEVSYRNGHAFLEVMSGSLKLPQTQNSSRLALRGPVGEAADSWLWSSLKSLRGFRVSVLTLTVSRCLIKHHRFLILTWHHAQEEVSLVASWKDMTCYWLTSALKCHHKVTLEVMLIATAINILSPLLGYVIVVFFCSLEAYLKVLHSRALTYVGHIKCFICTFNLFSGSD